MKIDPNIKKNIFRLSKPTIIVASAIILLGLVGAVAYRLYFGSFKIPGETSKETTLFLPETKTTAEDQAPPVLSGNQFYRLITSENPKFTEASIEPLDVSLGSRQTITAKVQNPSPIKSVSVRIITDTDEKVLAMSLIQGTEYNGVWSASHAMEDSYERIYRFRFTATDQFGSSTVTITSR